MSDNKRGLGAWLLGAALLAFMVFNGTALTARAEQAVLESADCGKCHEKQVLAIESDGGRHQTKVTCVDCHVEHRPRGKDVIPPCARCHEGRPHFSLANCLGCHSDPHMPMNLQLAADLTGPCLTCHEQQGQEFKEYPSKHSRLSCTFCHSAHGLIPECFQCHKPHVEDQTMPQCLGCHPVHQPRKIVYPMTTPRRFCVPCHAGIGELMAKTKTKHRNFTCAYCHRGDHPSMPTCRVCHGEPHGPEMIAKWPVCIDCHIDSHNLQK
ncbi:MAG: hypothetical protein A2521_08710 [Deltaproteobacteria bacterium RIFOXYD12_FULL_57_12]|nr:MAG: hypothetical protein A2521_08710 [Deltaproteobacteria bacterium RIFOXYD12_FULL_57_12]